MPSRRRSRSPGSRSARSAIPTASTRGSTGFRGCLSMPATASTTGTAGGRRDRHDRAGCRRSGDDHDAPPCVTSWNAAFCRLTSVAARRVVVQHSSGCPLARRRRSPGPRRHLQGPTPSRRPRHARDTRGRRAHAAQSAGALASGRVTGSIERLPESGERSRDALALASADGVERALEGARGARRDRVAACPGSHWIGAGWPTQRSDGAKWPAGSTSCSAAARSRARVGSGPDRARLLSQRRQPFPRRRPARGSP